MKRIIMVTTVALVMAAMMVAMAMPAAFAHGVDCTGKGQRTVVTPFSNGDRDGDSVVCYNPNSGRYQDDHQAPPA